MEEEETYLQLYLNQCAAQVSLEAAALSESGPASLLHCQVVRSKGFAFLSS